MSTIYDIAQKTGYSASTVSKVLNNYDNISEKAKKRINEVVKELNYIPNASARGLMTKKTNLIGLLLYEDHFEALLHAHVAEVLDSFKYYVECKGYDVLFVNTKKETNNHTYYEHCKYRSLDGVLIAIGDIQMDEQKRQIREVVESDLPSVSVETLYKNSLNVLSDNYNGAMQALDYLYFLGHRDIAYVDAKYSGSACGERLKAYRDFFETKGLDLKEKNIYTAESFSKSDGKEVGAQILRNGFNNLPSAIFCICDETALGVMEYFRKHGVRVPEDISIIGFDDIRVAEYVGLTTVRQNRKSIGTVAGQLLLEAIEGEREIETILIETELVIRNTCRSIK